LAMSGANNEWVLTFWIAAAAMYALQVGEAPPLWNGIMLGLSAGAAFLTKGSAFLYAPPLLIACVVIAWRWRRSPQLASLALALALCLLINTGQWLRNYEFNHKLFGMNTPNVSGSQKYTVDHVTASGFGINLVRESVSHFAPPTQGMADWM